MVSQREGEPDWGHHWSYLESVTRGWRPPKQPDDQRVTHVCRVKLAARRSLLKLSLHWPSRLGSERLESGFHSVFLMMKVTFFFFLLPISGPLPPFLFFCQLHQFSPLSLLPLPLAFLYDQKSKPLKTLSDQCHTVDTDSLLTTTATPSVCTQTDINHYRLDLEVCANTCMCVCVGVAFALFKWILPDSWYDWWQYKRWRWRGGGVYAKSCESAHMHLFPHSYSQSCRWAVPLGL